MGRSRTELYCAIRSILLDEWDPIGVAEIPEARDEYDAYVSPVRRLLESRVSKRELLDYLWWIETVHMRLDGDFARTERVAARLIGLVVD